MGLMTTVGLLNDYLCDIEKNPEGFVRELVDNIQCGGIRTTRIGQATILPSHHADDGQLVYAQGNLFTLFGYNGGFLFPMDLSRIALMERRRKEALRILRDSRGDISTLLRAILQNENVPPDELEIQMKRILR
jgi:hypothetical protein